MATLSQQPRVQSEWLDQFIFLGTGTSSQVPSIYCVTDPNTTCMTCPDAMRLHSFNRRGCTCALAVVAPPASPKDTCNILIDCGKTFYQSALSTFRYFRLRRIDAVLLTHGHADAILGLDDLRAWTMHSCIQDYVDVYLTQECMETVERVFPYLVDPSFITGGGDVGALRWHIIDADQPFQVTKHQVPIVPLRVEHGFAGPERKPFECLGFRIDSLSYVSDCHRIPPSTFERMLGSEVVVLDGLNKFRHPSHFSLQQAITTALQMALHEKPPRIALFTGMTHRVEYHTTDVELKQLVEGLRAYRQTLPDKLTNEWWIPAWDPAASEAAQTLTLSANMPMPTTNSQDPPEIENVPRMHLSVDGLSIKFNQS